MRDDAECLWPEVRRGEALTRPVWLPPHEAHATRNVPELSRSGRFRATSASSFTMRDAP